MSSELKQQSQEQQLPPAVQAAGLTYTPIDQIPAIVAKLRQSFLTRKTYDVEYRKAQLKSLAYCFKEHGEQIVDAIHRDLGRSRFESVFAELVLTTNDCIDAVNNLDKWAKPEKKWAGITWATHGSVIRKEPKGCVLVAGAWNYPITVQLGPMIAAIAAGNTVILKPSEVAAHTAKLLSELLPKYLDPECYAVVNGGIPETTALLDQRFEHIFYTGNGTVGRIFQEKAAKWLCPVSLELGGKSPVIVDKSADLRIAAHRILWGKGMNASQTCISPDYIICPREIQDALVAEFQKAAAEFWPNGSNASTKDYGRIINEGHWKRLVSVLDGTKGDVRALGGEADQAGKYIGPTIVANCSGEDSVMRGELFGPILPIVPVASINEAIEFVNARDQPLALYVFGNNAVVKQVVDNTRSGGVVVGDVMLHFAINVLPFGGTGPSGHGSYHGKAGFDTFTHARSELIAPHTGFMGNIVEKVMSFRYPPYTDGNLTKFKLLVEHKVRFAKPQNPNVSRTQIKL